VLYVVVRTELLAPDSLQLASNVEFNKGPWIGNFWTFRMPLN